MQDFTGRPSTRTRHWAHWPLAQKIPWGAPSLAWWPKIRIPLAKSAEAMVSPCRAETGAPFQVNATVGTAGNGENGMSFDPELGQEVSSSGGGAVGREL